jgi:hypothetical protein
MSVLYFYESLARHAPSLEPALQQEIRSYAERTKNTHLLVALLGRGDLTLEVENALRDSKDLAVLVAWASRPNRTPAELQERLLKETRVAALLPLAELGDLPDSVYRAIAEVKSTKLGEALAANTSAPLDVRAEKIKEFVARHPRRSYGVGELLTKLCNNEPLLFQAAAVSAGNAGYAAACVQSGFMTGTELEIIVGKLEGFLTSSSDPHGVISLIEALSYAPLTSEQIETIKTVSALIEGTWSPTYYRWVLSRLPEHVERMEKRQGPLTLKIRELADATDPNRISVLYQEAMALATDAEDAAFITAAVVMNPHTPLEIVIAEYEAHRVTHHQTRNLLERLDADGEVEVMARVLREHHGYAPIEGLVNAGAAINAVVAQLRSAHQPIPLWLRRAPWLADNADLALETLPWGTIIEMFPTATGELSAKLQHILLAELGSDRKLWEVFETIGNDYAGSFPELVATVKELA